MQIYDGSQDRRVFPTKHTVAVTSANRIIHSQKDHMTIRQNGRQDWSLFYCEAGCLHFDNQILRPGEIWIYPPHVPQNYIAYGHDHVIYHYLHFTGSDLEDMLHSLGIQTNVPIAVESGWILNAMGNIQAALVDDNSLSNLIAEYHTLYLISKLANRRELVSSTSAIHRAVDEMKHAFACKYDAAHYAKLLNISVSHFNHLFKKQIGVPPYAYLLNLRINNAAALLAQTTMKIRDIAEQCGFEDPLYFTQAFKKLRGMTPSQYRKQMSSIVNSA